MQSDDDFTLLGGLLICTNKGAQPEGHFSVPGACWPISKLQKTSRESALPPSFCNLSALSESHRIWGSHIAERAANLHLQSWTTRRPFQCSGGLLINQKKKQEKVRNCGSSATLLRSLKCDNFQGKRRNTILVRSVFANARAHLRPALNTCKVGAWRAALQKLIFLAILCSAACARLLVRVRCPLNCKASGAHFPVNH